MNEWNCKYVRRLLRLLLRIVRHQTGARCGSREWNGKNVYFLERSFSLSAFTARSIALFLGSLRAEPPERGTPRVKERKDRYPAPWDTHAFPLRQSWGRLLLRNRLHLQVFVCRFFAQRLRFIDFFLGLYSCAFSYSLTILVSTRIFDLEGMTLGGCNLRFFVLHIVLVEELSK